MWFTIEEFEAVAADYDRAVEKTPGISRFCSSADWILAAWRTLGGQARPCICRDGDNWVVLALGELLQIQRVLHPLEAAWLFACPIIGADREAGYDLFKRTLTDLDGAAQAIILGGIPEGGSLHTLIRQEKRLFRHLQSFEGSHCVVASLDGGEAGYLSRRSSRFRSNLRKQEEQVSDAGISFEVAQALNCDEIDEMLNRIVAIEAKSWKGATREGVFHHDDHIAFYRELMRRSVLKNTLRIVLAVDAGGQDAAFIFGVCLGNLYRGFQMSYDKQYTEIGLGNVCQWRMIRQLSSEGISSYDMGMSIDYKKRWAEEETRLINFFAVPAV